MAESNYAAESRRLRGVLPAILALALLLSVLGVAQPARAVAACSGNAIVCENQLPGTPKSEWDIDKVGDPTIQGFATKIKIGRAHV